MTLSFGKSYWDYLPVLIKNYIEDLAAKAVHRDRMKQVCKSIELHKQWCNQQIWVVEVAYLSYFELSLFSPIFIKSQECNKCFETFSPEIDLSKHYCRVPDIIN